MSASTRPIACGCEGGPLGVFECAVEPVTRGAPARRAWAGSARAQVVEDRGGSAQRMRPARLEALSSCRRRRRSASWRPAAPDVADRCACPLSLLLQACTGGGLHGQDAAQRQAKDQAKKAGIAQPLRRSRPHRWQAGQAVDHGGVRGEQRVGLGREVREAAAVAGQHAAHEVSCTANQRAAAEAHGSSQLQSLQGHSRRVCMCRLPLQRRLCSISLPSQLQKVPSSSGTQSSSHCHSSLSPAGPPRIRAPCRASAPAGIGPRAAAPPAASSCQPPSRGCRRRAAPGAAGGAGVEVEVPWEPGAAGRAGGLCSLLGSINNPRIPHARAGQQPGSTHPPQALRQPHRGLHSKRAEHRERQLLQAAKRQDRGAEGG